MGKFRVGQKVRLTNAMFNKGDFNEDTCARGWNPKMSEHFGQIVTIDDIDMGSEHTRPYVRVAENAYSWDFRFLQELKHAGVDIIDGLKFSDFDSLLPCGFQITKVIRNDRVVICFIYNSFTGQINKTIARCDYEDTFDLSKGVEICVWKMIRKIACNNLKRLGR